MKRTTINIESILLCTLALCSCEKFLNRFPYDENSASVAFSSAVKAESVLSGAYSNLSYDYTSPEVINWDAFSGVLDPQASAGLTDNLLFLAGTMQKNDSMFLTWWKRLYEGINRANDVISHIDAVPDMSSEIKACRKSEARFLRAYHYYRLNCLWRGVPVYLENLGPDQYTKARSTEEQVWQVIIDDLNECIACESLPDKYASSSSSYGRVTKGACHMLRGKVYMWMKEWAKAEADFRAVTTMGYSLPNSVSYDKLFTLPNERCDEMIFSFQAENISGAGNVFSRTYGNWETAGNGNNTYYVSTDFVDSYECADGKPFSWDDYLPGYSTMKPAERKIFFCRDGLTAQELNTLKANGADITKYLSEGNEARIKAAYEDRDPRLLATVITPYSEYKGGFYGEELTYVLRYPYRSDEAGSGNDIRTRRNDNMLYCPRKFVNVGRECTDVNYNPVDVPIFRYADLLLLLAEAINEQGPSRFTEAMTFVNEVRSRAGVANLGTNPYTTVDSQENMRSRIRNEKRWELALEEVLYTEELRWGTWKEFRFGKNAGLKELWGTNITTYTFGGDHYLLWAIPSSEAERNTNLKQNPGWL